jgi:hypothetical protein
MNTSFGTIDSVLGPNGEPGNSVRRLPMGSIRQQAESSCASILDEATLGGKQNRYSPSIMNDSEPPSYFDVIGRTPSSCLNAAAGTTRLSTSTQLNPSMQLPKIVLASSRLTSYNKDAAENPPIMESPSCHVPPPNHRRMHPLQMPMSLNPNQVCYSNSNLNNTTMMNASTDSIQKPCPTYLIWSIFTTFYCVFIGVPALVLSIKVHHYNKRGFYQKAYTRSKIAKYLNVTGLFFGFIYLGAVGLTFVLPRR